MYLFDFKNELKNAIPSNRKPFISDIDGKEYIDLLEKSSIRRRYTQTLIDSKILKLGSHKIGRDSLEKLPPEIGYSLDFRKATIIYGKDISKDHEIVDDDDLSREMLYKVMMDHELADSGFGERHLSLDIAEYYADVIWNYFIPKTDKAFVISGPASSGLTSQEATRLFLLDKYDEFTTDRYNGFRILSKMSLNEGRKNEEEVYKDYKDVLICDDCLITGNSIRKEIEKNKQDGLNPIGVLVGFDAGLYGGSGEKISKEISKEANMPVISIVNAEEVIRCLYDISKDRQSLFKVKEKFLKRGSNVEVDPRDERIGDIFYTNVYEPFIKFMKMQRKIVDLQETARIIREGR